MTHRRLARLLLLATLVVLAGCRGPLATPPPEATQAPAVATETVAPATPTPVAPSPTPSPSPSPTPGPAHLSLRGPVWLGRGRIVDACFSLDGRLLAVGWASGVSLWSTETGAERWWQPTDANLIAVDLDPQGRAVAAALEDGSVVVLAAADGSARRFTGARPGAYWGDIAWSPQGERLALQFIGPSRGDPIYLLDPESGAVTEVPGSEISDVISPYLAWSPDGAAITLASGAQTCSALVDVRTGQERLRLASGEACYSPYGLAWSPDGKAFAGRLSWVGKGLALLDAQSGQVLRSLEGEAPWAPAHSGRSLVFSADGRLLALRGGQAPHPVGWTPLVIWDTATGRIAGQLSSRSEREDRLAVALADDSALCLYATGEITRWPIGAGEAEETVVARLPVLVPEPLPVWSADGRRLAAAGRSGGVMVWDTATGTPLATFGAAFSAPGLCADGRLLALTDDEKHEEVIYDLAAGKIVRTLPDASPILQGAAFSPDSRLIAYASGNRARVAEVASGRVLAELTGYPEGQAIARALWSPDGNALVVASGHLYAEQAGPIILWQRGEDGAFREVYRSQSVRNCYWDQPVALFSPGGALVAFEDFPRAQAGMMSVQVFDRTSGQTLLSLKEYILGAWVSDEVLLASESEYYTRLTHWNVRSGAKTVGGARGVGGNVYAPGGGYYAVASGRPYSGRGVEVHDTERGYLMCRVPQGAALIGIGWSPDGRRIASLGGNGAIALWAVESEACEEQC